MEAEVNVFLKCLSCETFITSPSFSVIRKHFEKCQKKRGENTSRNLAEEIRNTLFDIDCYDFIDEQTETVTFDQPSLHLKRCNSKHFNLKKPAERCDDSQTLFTTNPLPSSAHQNKINRAKRKSYLTASTKLSELIKTEYGTKKTSVNFDGSLMNSDKFLTRKTGTKKQKCDKCEKYFNPRYLRDHKKIFHSNGRIPLNQEGTHCCPFPNCGIKCKTVPLLKCHVILHLEKNPYACNFPGCNAKADAPCHLKQHIILTHVETPIICPKCGVTYSRKLKLKVHGCEANVNKLNSGKFKLVEISGFWRLKPVEYNNDDNLPLDPRFISTPKLDTYDPTDKVNQYIESVKRIDVNAIIRADPGFIQACKDSPGFGEYLLGHQYFNAKFRPLQKRVSSIFKCSRCATTFTGRHGYNIHKRKHCAKSNDDGSKISTHEQNKDTGGKAQIQIGCPVCGRTFESDAILENHLSQDHRSDEVFKCNAPGCRRYFHSAKARCQHFQLLHINRPYQCEKCRLSFASQTNLDRHLEEHRLDPDLGANKTPPCDVCGKVLFNLDSRRRHMQTQHGITVPLAWKQFESKKKTKITKPKKTEPEFSTITDEMITQVKIEPELTIDPDVVTREGSNFQSYDEQIGKHEGI